MLAEELVSTLERCKERYSPEEYENIVSAEYAQSVHANQVRESGDPMFSSACCGRDD